MPRSIWRTALIWLTPSAAFLALYYPGLWVWFHTDDFTLLRQASLPAYEFLGELLQPRAQGTFRPLSERLFFFAFYNWFGLDAFPYRLLVFATQIANLVLLGALARKLTGSSLAALAAPTLWGVHHGLGRTMAWSSAYNQALCSTFLLASLLLFVRYAERGKTRYWWAQFATFLAGFGALEINVVYPAIALSYALLFARDRWLSTLPMFTVSAAFALFQSSTVRNPADELYTLHLDPASLLATLGAYLDRACTADRTAWLLAATALPLFAASLYQASKARFAGVFGWTWFFATLAPYLPLARHISDYYLFIPAAGLALAAGATVSRAPRISAACAALFLWAALPSAREKVEFFRDMSVQIRDMASGVSHAREQHPDKTILLAEIPSEVFYASVYHELFPLIGVYDIYLAPDLVELDALPGHDSPDEHLLSREETLLAIRRNSLVVYDASHGRLREITSNYRAFAPLRLQDE